MSIHDELLTLMAKPTTDEEWLNIDWESRLITVPSSLTNIGVYNDKDTNRLYFRCPIEYGEFKIADFGIHVNYQNTGISTTKYDGDVYFVDDVESDGEYLTFSWLVGRHAYLEEGTTAFIVCCKVIDGDDNVVNELNTTVATLSVLEGLEVDVLPPEDYPDYLEEILKRCEAAEEAADKAIQGINVNGVPAEVIDHVAQLDIDSGGVYYGTCDTAWSVATKDVEIVNASLTLQAGMAVEVYFENRFIDDSPKLNVNGTGAYPIWVNGGVADEGNLFVWSAGSTILFVFDGKYWIPTGFKETYYAECDTAAGTSPKTIDTGTAVLAIGTVFTIKFNEGNTVSQPILQVCGLGLTGRGNTICDAGESISWVWLGGLGFVSTSNAAALTGVSVNGKEAPVTDHVAEVETPTELSELDNDVGYITNDALDGYALEDQIPTKVSQLDNDSGYITDDALDGYAKESDVESVKETADSALETATEAKEAIPTKVSELTNDVPYVAQNDLDEELANINEVADSALEKATETAESAITGINVNGTAQPVNNNIAELTIEEGGGAIEKIEVNGEEQPIVDKTVNLDIDRASVDDETLIVGDTTGGSSHIVTGVVTESETPKVVTFDNPIFVVATDDMGTSAWGVNPDGDYKEICENADAHFDGNTLSVGNHPCTYFAILED